MAFYNRALAQVVAKFVDLQGKVEPLDVVPYGGLFIAQATTSSSAALLPAPSAGLAYRLQRLTCSNIAVLVELKGASTGVVYGQIGGTAQPFQAVDNLEGLLTTEGLSVAVSGAVTAYLFYDLMTLPSIS